NRPPGGLRPRNRKERKNGAGGSGLQSAATGNLGHGRLQGEVGRTSQITPQPRAKVQRGKIVQNSSPVVPRCASGYSKFLIPTPVATSRVPRSMHLGQGSRIIYRCLLPIAAFAVL